MRAEAAGGPKLAALATEVAAARAISAALGRRQASLAVPERAQPAVLAALARASGRRPLVVCTVTEATRNPVHVCSVSAVPAASGGTNSVTRALN